MPPDGRRLRSARRQQFTTGAEITTGFCEKSAPASRVVSTRSASDLEQTFASHRWPPAAEGPDPDPDGNGTSGIGSSLSVLSCLDAFF